MAENGNPILIESLLKNPETKDTFFTPVLDNFVFKTKEFKDFLDYSSSNNSYSAYLGKKIGLYCGDEALTDRSEVVLNFPFKDCVLEGGQKKEEVLIHILNLTRKSRILLKNPQNAAKCFFTKLWQKTKSTAFLRQKRSAM